MTFAFGQWLRTNSEHYLLEAAQQDMARRYLGGSAPPRGGGPLPFFWRRIFVPAYRLLPWQVRRGVIAAMPGSHRREWRRRAAPYTRRRPQS